MVKGITKQVVVVKSPDQKLFEQAIFLVKDSVLTEGGITEEALLREARIVCRHAEKSLDLFQRLLWAGIGAFAVAALWILTVIL